MQSYQKELLLARIRCGYYIYKGKHITLHVYHPTKEQNYEAQLVFAEAYEEAYAEEEVGTVPPMDPGLPPAGPEALPPPGPPPA